MGRSFSPNRSVAAIIALALLLIGKAARAADAELVLPVTINEVARGETPAIIAGDDVFVPLSTLERGGLTGAMWQRVQIVAALRAAVRTVQSERAVSLKALAPWATFAFNEANLTLSITFKPDLMQRQALAITGAKPADISYRHDNGGFVNYAVTSAGGSRPSGFGEAAATVHRALVYTAFSDTPEDGVVRGFSNVTYDQLNSLRRWTAGDAPIFSDELGGSGIAGGVTIARSFDIDPYFIRYPSLSLRGIAATPSQVDVYVNGVLVSRQTIQPGPFDVQNVPGVAGPTATQVVVRDVFGREQTQSSSFYYSTAVLGRGVSDYIYSAGVLRENFGRKSFDYGKPVLLAFHRYGLTDRTTISGRVEATEDVVSAGSGISFASRLGDLDLKAAGSSGHGLTGTAGQIGVRRLSRRANLAAAFRMFSRDYQNFSLGAETDRPLNEVIVSAAYLPKWGNIGAQYSRATLRDNGRRDRLSLLTNIPLIEPIDLMLTATFTDNGSGNRIGEYFAGVSLHGWDRNTVNVGAVRSDNDNAVTAEIQQPLPLGDGFGYRVQTTAGIGQTDGLASAQYQNRYGRYEVNAPMRHGSLAANVAGGVVFEGGKVVPTRPVAQSFALVRVPGVDNVRVYLSNQLIGRTDSKGDLLVPNMLAYYGNRIRIDDRDIPMNYDVQMIEQTIAPPNRGGALVEFPVRAIRTVTGSVVVKKGTEDLVPAYGQITVTRDGRSAISPLGATGEFYFENLIAGSYEAFVEYETGSCKFALTVPESQKEVIETGRVVCSGATKP